ncbi:MAG: hypothetical protein ABS52_03635 [Gemmatimonadetes bacterium SCN 70-22]|nr:MAG: hypothetical protein ABS52_03635 [Gemmatimonadetes bacterium SCN 70-22]
MGRLSRAALERAELLLPRRAELRDRARDAAPRPSLAQALRGGETVAIIAEIKRRSPSKGVINAAIDAGDRSRLYAESGARALSILTEPAEFGGSADDLRMVAGQVAIPLLKKDFHVHEVQVWEARALGASAMLFIARALAPDMLRRLVDLAVEAGVEPLIEIRSEAELEVALMTPAQAIGVNARDLETLVVDAAVTERVLPRIPEDRIRVAESGMATPRDVARAASLGAHAALIGSSLSAAADPAATLRALAGVARGGHGG